MTFLHLLIHFVSIFLQHDALNPLILMFLVFLSLYLLLFLNSLYTFPNRKSPQLLNVLLLFQVHFVAMIYLMVQLFLFHILLINMLFPIHIYFLQLLLFFYFLVLDLLVLFLNNLSFVLFLCVYMFYIYLFLFLFYMLFFLHIFHRIYLTFPLNPLFLSIYIFFLTFAFLLCPEYL